MGVARLSCQHRFLGGLNDRLGGREIRFSKTEVDDFTTLQFKGFGSLHDFHGEKRRDFGGALGDMFFNGCMQEC